MKRIRTVAAFPTMFTLGNLVCGFFAIVVAVRVVAPTSPEVEPAPAKIMQHFDKKNDTHNLMLSGWLILLAMIFDALDGHVARLTNTPSEFGAQLDSLADLVTFGVAPGFMLVKMCSSFAFAHRQAVWMIAATFACCAALRLARFNVESDENDDHTMFSGLPTPAAGAAIASFAILFYELRKVDEGHKLVNADQLDQIVQTGLPFFALLFAALMVSRIPYPHLVNLVFRGQKSIGHIVALVFAFAAVMTIRGYAVPLVCLIFAFWPPLVYFWRRMFYRNQKSEPLF